MPEMKRKVVLPGIGTVDGVDVSIKEVTERWTEVTLEDGTVLKIKPNVISATRVDGHFDQDGNPFYALASGNVMTANAPAHLKKPVAAVDKRAN